MYRGVHSIPKQILSRLYHDKQWTLRDIADYFQCSVDTIQRRMVQYDIKRRPSKKSLSRVSLTAMYETGRWPMYKLARHFGVSAGTISNRLREYGLLCQRDFSVKAVDTEWIRRAYESGNSTGYIAKATGLSRWKVLHILRTMGTVVRGGRKQHQRIEEMAYLYTHHNMSTEDIGLAYGLQAGTVALYLREFGITLRGRMLALDEHKIRKLRAEGASVARIARVMGCSVSAVRSRLKAKPGINDGSSYGTH